ncbi:MAG TPA: sugar transferase [Pyrinomonadaceae bacterium]|jgi:exopolysaccharide biosynthesis polyprenyl glycosylphosphotransferase|nr:sugar transferase [Pyrinomonadaceae bacterium]
MIARYGQLANLFLKVSDLLLMLCALSLAIVINYAPEASVTASEFALDFLSTRVKVANALLGAAMLAVWYVVFNLQGIYRSHRLSRFTEELKEIGRAVFLASLMLLTVAQIGAWRTITLWTAACVGVFGLVLIVAMRVLLRLNLRRLRLRGHNIKTLLIVGGGPRAHWFANEVRERTDLGYRIIGYVDDETNFNGNGVNGVPRLGDVHDLPGIIANDVIDEVFVALPIKSQYSQIETAINLLEEQGIMVHMFTDHFPHRLARSHPSEFEGAPLLSLHSAPPVTWRTEIKRMLDIAVAAISLLLLSPLFAIVALAIRLDSHGPVFFIQNRVGFNKRRFRMIKFRTMCVDAEARMQELEHLNEKTGPIFKITNDPRTTRVGKWLRKMSIDELPQLINVLIGDMSIVGPRPLSVRDALRMELAWQKRRFSVKPGLTCLWQVSGRSNLSFEQWMQLDLEYIDRWSLGLDGIILLRTIPAILLARGAS